MQLRAPFPVENQDADNRRKGQKGVKGGSGCGDLIHIKHFVNDILFFIQIALPEVVGNGHADNCDDGDWQRGFKREVDERHFCGFGGQHHVAGGRREDNGGRRGANGRRGAATDTDVHHHREQRGHQQNAQTGCRRDGQRHQTGDKIGGDHQQIGRVNIAQRL